MSKALAVIVRITKTEQEMKRYVIIYLIKKFKINYAEKLLVKDF